MENKYISFDPWWGGMNNVRMSYECAAAMSVVSNRKLIIPPKVYILFFSEHSNKKTYFDFWKIWDKKAFKSQFDTIEYKDVPELQKYNTDKQYFDGICSDYKCITFGDAWTNHGPQEWMGQYMIYGEVQSDPSFFKFKELDRPTISLNTKDKILHFPSSLLGYWYFHVYNEPHHKVKEKLKKGLKLRPEFIKKAKELMPDDYDSLHIRRGDFLNTRKPSTLKLYETLQDSLSKKIKKGRTIFIATDEKDKTLFDFLKKTYNIVFLSDLTKDKDHVELALDMEICANGKLFYGSQYSTFTDYIHILRHYKNNTDCSRIGLNYEKPTVKNKEIPWLEEQYGWDNLWVHLY